MNNTQPYQGNNYKNINQTLIQSKKIAYEYEKSRNMVNEKAKKLEELNREISNNTDVFCKKYGINIDSSEVIAISAKLKSLIQYLNTNMKTDEYISLFYDSRFTVLIGDSHLSEFLNIYLDKKRIRIFKINKNLFCMNFAIFVFKIYLIVKDNIYNMISVERVMNIMKDTVEMNEKKTNDETQEFPWKSFFTSVWLSPENLYLILLNNYKKKIYK